MYNKGKSTPCRGKGCLHLGNVKLSKSPPSGHFVNSVLGIPIHLQKITSGFKPATLASQYDNTYHCTIKDCTENIF